MKNIYLDSFSQVLKEDTILYFEDSDTLNNSIDKYLNKMFKRVIITKDVDDTMKGFVEHKIDMLIVDIHNSYCPDRIEMLNSIKSFAPYIPMMVVSNDKNIAYVLQNLTFGISHVILKPLEQRVLLKEINKIYHNLDAIESNLVLPKR